MALSDTFRLLRAGFVLAREGALSLVDLPALPPMVQTAVRLGSLLERPSVKRSGSAERLGAAFGKLGPTYVKLGQTLATRPDIVGINAAADLAQLQDKMAPFDPALVPVILNGALHEKAADLVGMTAPIAAASIAQVHKATLRASGVDTPVAVKILRPGVKARFRADLQSFYAGARLADRWAPALRRLRPIEIVRILDRSSQLELDLRLEAASMSEMAENIKDDQGFRIPTVYWDQTAETVLTTSWVNGIPMRDIPALEAAGIDRRALARNLLQSFLKHAVRDGFFHADMHPGNLFVDPKTGDIIAVDFGIMGRLSLFERRFLADILFGFITRDYRLIAQRHFDIGYVPPENSIDDFALALRSIGEPLQGRTAEDISMAKVLGQLFQTTELFQMRARPELILLQKSMVLVEGVSRTLDPQLNIWTVSEPVVGDFVRREAGPMGRIDDLRDRFGVAVDTVGRLPSLVQRAETALGDWEKDRVSPQRHRQHLMLVVAFWTFMLLALLAAIRLLR